MGMKVAKFGGSSLADAAQFKKVREILLSDEDRRIVVPSAPGKRGATDIKVTDPFYQCNRLAASGSDFASAFDTIRARYHGIAQELGLTVDLDGYLDEVSRNIQLGAGADYAASRGEYLNGILLADYLGWDFVDPQQGIFLTKRGGWTAIRHRKSSARCWPGISARLCRAFTDAIRTATSKPFPAAAVTSRARLLRARFRPTCMKTGRTFPAV